MLNRFCCQSSANFDELPGVIHAKHEECASNATVNDSVLDDPNPRRGLGIVDFMKEKNFRITGATGFVAKGIGESPSLRFNSSSNICTVDLKLDIHEWQT
jgi:hypothetical protein